LATSVRSAHLLILSLAHIRGLVRLNQRLFGTARSPARSSMRVGLAKVRSKPVDLDQYAHAYVSYSFIQFISSPLPSPSACLPCAPRLPAARPPRLLPSQLPFSYPLWVLLPASIRGYQTTSAGVRVIGSVGAAQSDTRIRTTTTRSTVPTRRSGASAPLAAHLRPVRALRWRRRLDRGSARAARPSSRRRSLACLIRVLRSLRRTE
jgi:hypothetical protein